MGACLSADTADSRQLQKSSKSKKNKFAPIPDQYETLEEVQQALNKAGLEASNMIIGIDYTKSNLVQGAKTFDGKSLHAIEEDVYNPYQQVIHILGRTLSGYNEDEVFKAFGFGDKSTKDYGAFPIYEDTTTHQWPRSIKNLLNVYSTITPQIQLSGPTNYAPLIYKAIEACKGTPQNGFRATYHILVIIADGLVVSEQETIDAIVEASKYPLSIVLIGVGDGPFDQCIEFDDNLPERHFDNFQFVNFHEVISEAKAKRQNTEIAFALSSLMEIPDQYQIIKSKQYLGKKYHQPQQFHQQQQQFHQQQQQFHQQHVNRTNL